MAVNQKVQFCPSDLTYKILTTVGQTEMLQEYKPEELLRQIHYQIAVQIAGKVMERLAPAINEALENMKLETEEKAPA